MTKFNHVMVKLETTSTEYNAGILCIAAVKFNFDNSTDSEEFIAYINPVSFKDYDLRIDVNTLKFIREHRPDVWLACRKSPLSIVDGLSQFSAFLGNTPTNNEMWGNGIDFVFPCLKSSFMAVELPLPYKWYNVRDLRTVLSLSGSSFKHYSKDITDPLEVCRQQVNILKNILVK